MIQSSDGWFYKDFCHELDGIKIKDDTVSTIYNKYDTRQKLQQSMWFGRIYNQRPELSNLKVGDNYELRKVKVYNVEWLDWIPTPALYKIRTEAVTNFTKIFIVKPTQQELEDLRKSIYSDRIRIVLGGMHLNNSVLKRRLNKSMIDGIIYSPN